MFCQCKRFQVYLLLLAQYMHALQDLSNIFIFLIEFLQIMILKGTC